MTLETKRLEVFQELSLRGPPDRIPLLREALLDCVVTPWVRADERPKPTGLDADLLRFQREAEDRTAEATLALFSQPDGYMLANIVPLKTSQLTYGEYNAILQDFARRIAEPAALQVGFEVKTTPSLQSIEDWLPVKAAKALRLFSLAANKSTGSSHPMDQERWFNFLIEAHADDGLLDSQRLARWLIEVEGWGENEAHNLASEYEFGLALLNKYDPRTS